MQAIMRLIPLITVGLAAALTFSIARGEEKLVRVGMVGCDTSHAPRYAKLINEKARMATGGVRVVAVFPTKSNDIASSYERVEKFTAQLREQGVRLVGSMEQLLSLVDAVMIESIDGRKHLEQAQAVIAAGKPLFIDKPAAASLADVIAIYDLAKKHGVPCFSSSSMRFSADIRAACNDHPAGEVVGCETYSPCPIEPHHPDLYWYGVHGVEMLFAIMGPGCESVSRSQTEDADLVVGIWKDGRIGSYRGLRKGPSEYGAIVFGNKAITSYPVKDTRYQRIADAIEEFFRTNQSPVNRTETLEIFAFMEAAEESKRQGGAAIRLDNVLSAARDPAGDRCPRE